MINTLPIGLTPTLSLGEMTQLIPQKDIAMLLSAGTKEALSDISPNHLRNVMEVLGVLPVWGRNGNVVYRFNFEGTVRVFVAAPDPAVDFIPANILERQWHVCESLSDLIQKLIYAQESAGFPEWHLQPEDHPEERSIGFISPETNEVWLLDMDLVTKSLQEGGTKEWPQVQTLICTNEGRTQLASLLTQKKLLTEAQFMQTYGRLTPTPRGVPNQDPGRYIVRYKIVGDI